MNDVAFLALHAGTIIEHSNGKYYALGDPMGLPGITDLWRTGREVTALTPLTYHPDRTTDILMLGASVTRIVSSNTTTT